jgi:penicillin-binding protein 2
MPKPMFNYATMGSGPPGSTFKPLVAIAALQEKNITPSTIIVDRGKYTAVKGFSGACWLWNQSHGTHGDVNIAKALEVSCNYFFFETGRRLGYANFENWASKFGLAADPQTGVAPTTGIEIGEKPGSVSSPDKYKVTNINLIMRDQVVNYLKDYKYGGYIITKGTEEYTDIKAMFMSGVYDEKKLLSIGIGNTKALKHLKNQIHIFDTEANSVGQLLNASIGQGTTLLTPLQMVNYISTLVNGGNRYKLHLVKRVLDPNGEVKKEVQPELIDKVQLDPANVNAVKDGMRKVTEEGGTASTAFNGFKIPTGGKTGSASVSTGQKNHGRSAYGWYVGFAPLDNPQIAVCVVIYDAGHGGSVAPVARAIYNQYFGLNKPTTVNTTGSSINGNVH